MSRTVAAEVSIAPPPPIAPRLNPCQARHYSGLSLYDDLPIHPRVRFTDVVVVARLIEGEGLRLAGADVARIPVEFLRRGRVRGGTDVGPGHRRPRLDPDAARPEPIFHVVFSDLDLVHPRAMGPVGPATVGGGGGGHSACTWPVKENAHTASPWALPLRLLPPVAMATYCSPSI